MEFDLVTTAVAFVVIVAAGVGGLVAAPIAMTTETILMMVAPSMLAFGLVCVFLGVRYGEHRATAAR
ncbi:MAG: hypothetical protein ABEJ40_08680 [Haloarculaceae archaeon]